MEFLELLLAIVMLFFFATLLHIIYTFLCLPGFLSTKMQFL